MCAAHRCWLETRRRKREQVPFHLGSQAVLCRGTCQGGMDLTLQGLARAGKTEPDVGTEPWSSCSTSSASPPTPCLLQGHQGHHVSSPVDLTFKAPAPASPCQTGWCHEGEGGWRQTCHCPAYPWPSLKGTLLAGQSLLESCPSLRLSSCPTGPVVKPQGGFGPWQVAG